MNIALTESRMQLFSCLSRQVYDLVIWTKENGITIIYSTNKESSLEIKNSKLSDKLKISRDKFVNPEVYNSIYLFDAKTSELLDYLGDQEFSLEKIPKYIFGENNFH